MSKNKANMLFKQ